MPETVISVNTGVPIVVYLQTQDMLDTYKLYREVMLVNVAKKRKNRYGLFQIHFTGINNFGRAVVFAIGFTNIKCKESYRWIFEEFSKKCCLANNLELPSVILTSMEQDLLDGYTEVFGATSPPRHLVSQYYLLQGAKDVLGPFKKRIDF